MKKNVLNRAVSLYPRQGAIAFLPFFCTVLLGKWGYPTPENAILHPILHPKLSVNTGHPVPWCRKCRRFSKTFFIGGGGWKRCNGPETAKHRTSLSKSTDVLHRKYGCLSQRSPMFLFSEIAATVARPCLIEHATATESKVPGKQNTQIIQIKKRGQLLEPVSLL